MKLPRLLRTALYLPLLVVLTWPPMASAQSGGGAVWGVGGNQDGQLGDGSSVTYTNPVEVLGVGASGVVAVAAGAYHTLFLKADGSLWTMGDNTYGQLGDGTTVDRHLPVAVLGAGSSGVIAVEAGGYHSMFLKNDGSLWAMGRNVEGQLGDGTNTSRSVPVAVLGAGASAVTRVSAGWDYCHFIRSDASLWGMGLNDAGRLGDGTTTSRNVPVRVIGAGASGVVAVSAGSAHCHFLKNDGSLWGMGVNSFGRLGDGTTIDRATPVAMVGAGASGVVELAGGGANTLFLKTDGSLWSVGYNLRGRLGDGTTIDRSTPVAVVGAGRSGVVGIGVGIQHCLFVKNDGSIWGFGRNQEGQLGDGTLTNRLSPVPMQGAGASRGLAMAGGWYHSIFLRGTGEGAITGVSPNQTALGMTLTVTGRGFSARSVTARLVQADFSTRNPKRYTLSVVKGSLTDSQVQVVAKSGKVGVYHLELYRRGEKLPYTLARAVTLMPPAITAVNPTVAARNTLVTIGGAFFGQPKGTVTLTQGTKRTRVKVLWTDTGISFMVPKKQKAGSYQVTVKTKLGSHTFGALLTVTE